MFGCSGGEGILHLSGSLCSDSTQRVIFQGTCDSEAQLGLGSVRFFVLEENEDLFSPVQTAANGPFSVFISDGTGAGEANLV